MGDNMHIPLLPDASALTKETLKIEPLKHYNLDQIKKQFFENRIFGSHPETKEYHLNHFRRYLLTLEEMVSLPTTTRVLEIGAPPYGLTYLMKILLFEDITLSGFDEKNPEKTADFSTDTIDLSKSDQEKIIFNEYRFNIETHNWPFPNEAFDLIVCSEVLEHLALDPMCVFSESNRILKPGGRLLITVPNAIGVTNLVRLIRGEQPSSFPPYRPEGINLRHNREITPYELSELFRAGGFGVENMKTINIAQPETKGMKINFLNLILSEIHDITFRKDFLLATGIKNSPVIDRFPLRHKLYFEWDVPRLVEKNSIENKVL
ncbi:MAG: class I SAM-dependent methyltransferase [Bacteroidales bacterium]|nr:class I SAM-dependent methyltransferase [Bacteroidales bacterium]